MSTRRAARAARVTGSRSEEIPAALASRSDPVWSDPHAVAELARLHAVHGYEEPTWDLAITRFTRFRRAWAAQHGLLTKHGEPDRELLRANGVDPWGSARARYAETTHQPPHDTSMGT